MNIEKPTAYMMLGLPGSGKTTYSKQLAAQLGADRVSLDEEYFNRVGNNGQEYRDFEVEAEVQSAIDSRVSELLAENKSVVLDYCPWLLSKRLAYKQFIEELGAKCMIYYFDYPKEELLRRFEARNEQKDDATQFMTPAMLDDFYARFDPPAPDEEVVVING